jgi:hypothetical protein
LNGPLQCSFKLETDKDHYIEPFQVQERLYCLV